MKPKPLPFCALTTSVCLSLSVCVQSSSSNKGLSQSTASAQLPTPRSSTPEPALTKLPSLLRTLEGGKKADLALVGSCQLPQVRRERGFMGARSAALLLDTQRLEGDPPHPTLPHTQPTGLDAP